MKKGAAKFREGFFWKLFLGHAMLVLLAMVACLGVATVLFDRLLDEQLTNSLLAHAALLEQQTAAEFQNGDATRLDQRFKQWAKENPNGIRITLIRADGEVVAESTVHPALMESHAEREEIKQALQSGLGQSTRWSNTVNRDMKYVALRVGSGDEPIGVVRVSLPVQRIIAQAGATRNFVWMIAGLILVIAIALALGLAKLCTGPVARMAIAAQELSKGRLSTEAVAEGSDELAVLGHSLNRMRDHLRSQLATITHQRDYLQHLLARLHEGVLVANASGRIVLLNPAAAQQLGIPEPILVDDQGFEGMAIEACVRQPELRELLVIKKLTTASDRLEESDAQHGFAEADGRQLEIDEKQVTIPRTDGCATVLARAVDVDLPEAPAPIDGKGSASVNSGRLLVLTDITDLQRTIQVKTDFAANASHELRTPLSAIRTAIETLATMNLREEVDDAAHFMDIIDRHSHRMDKLVTDLLDVSSAESVTKQYDTESIDVSSFLVELDSSFAGRADAKEVAFRAESRQGDFSLTANRYLLTLAVDNLVDNAIKFTEAGGKVQVTAAEACDGVEISVEDTGCGISLEEQERIFERFYQVDQARSGSTLRGTGLGLSIVRHAVAGMRGSIDLGSELGRGTTICITIPNGEQRNTDPRKRGDATNSTA